MFGPDSTYRAIQWYWLLGALLPVLFYILMRIFPRSPARLLSAPIMLGAMGWLPPYVFFENFLHKTRILLIIINSATPLSFFAWVYFGLIFNKFIRSRYPGWWHNYNYITAAALDAGLILSTIVIFFAITLPGVEIPQWWGNVGVQNTLVSFLPYCLCMSLDTTNGDH